MQLTPNLATIIFEMLNFLALVVVLYFILFKPIMKRVEERAQQKAALLQQIREDQAAAATLRAELETRLASAETEAATIISEAQDKAEHERAELLKETQAEVERILVEAHADAYRVRKQAVDEFHEELLDAILEISGMVVGQLAPDGMHLSMIQQLSDRIWELGRGDMARVESFRRSLGDRAPTAYVTTARPLSSEMQGLLARTFTALADRNVNLDIQVDPSLAVGVRVRLGDIVVDNSIAGQLDGLRENVALTLKEQLSDE